MIERTTMRMADGRQLIYFDEEPGLVRTTRDTRQPAHVAAGSEIRFDRLLDEWVAVASHRQARTFLPPTTECPLCPSTPEHATEIPADDYDVVVFENRFPSFMADPGGITVGSDDMPANGRRRPGRGRCEVVCFTPDHDSSFASLPPERVDTVMQVWADRTAALSAEPGIEQVFPFENRGEAIGVTLSHPHGQVYGYPFVTPRTQRMLAAAGRHLATTGRSLFEDVVDDERNGVRLVAETDHWVAFVPAAARWPIEVHIYPLRRMPDLTAVTAVERTDFVKLYLDVLGRLERFHGIPLPYIAAWHQAPVREGRDLAALHLEIFSIQRTPDKLKYLAGSESAMGVFINDVLPEQTAQRLRELAL